MPLKALHGPASRCSIAATCVHACVCYVLPTHVSRAFMLTLMIRRAAVMHVFLTACEI